MRSKDERKAELQKKIEYHRKESEISEKAACLCGLPLLLKSSNQAYLEPSWEDMLLRMFFAFAFGLRCLGLKSVR